MSRRNQRPASLINPPRRARWYFALACLLIVAVAALVYGWNLGGPFVFDDAESIEGQPSVQRGEVVQLLLRGGPRRIALASFALNRLLTGGAPLGFRVTNVAIHALAGMVLFDLVQLTLRKVQWAERQAVAVALVAALAWAAHPLATQGVSYIVQRMESLTALFYLAALWSLACSTTATRPWPWLVLGVAACWLGALTKETLLTLPLVALLYDRAFLAADLREIWRKRWPFYVATCAAAVFVVGQSLSLFAPAETADVMAAGWNLPEVTPWEYLRTEPLVILHYLRLSIAPFGQSFDYGWPVAEHSADWLPAFVLVSVMVIASFFFAWRKPKIGFLPAAFFLILAPTSSIMPVRDLAVEHRMYLPLAAVLTMIVVIGAVAWTKFVEPKLAPRRRTAVPFAVAGVAIALLAATAIARNEVYRSDLALWRDVVTKSPQNGRGHYAYARALAASGQSAAAMAHFREARALDARYQDGDTTVAESLFRANRPQLARQLSEEILRDNADCAAAHTILALVDESEGNLAAAHGHYSRSVDLDRRDPETRALFARLLIARGEFNAAAMHIDAALEIDKKHAGAIIQRAAWHTAQGEYGAACDWYRRAVEVSAADSSLWCHYGQSLFFAGRVADAREALERALQLNPDDAAAYNALGSVCAASGDVAGAETAYRQAIAMQPQFAEVQLNLGNLLARQRPAASRKAYETALAIDPNFLDAHIHLATLLAETQPQVAQQHLRRAIEIDPQNAQAYFQLANLHVLQGDESAAIEEYRRALQADPNFTAAREALEVMATPAPEGGS